MEQAEKNNEVVNETLSDAGAAPSYSAEQEPINADHVSIDDVRVDSAESDEDSPAVDTSSADVASAENDDDVLTVESVQTGILEDGAVLVTETGPKFVEHPATDVPKKPKAFSIARVDACVLSMWEHVNAGSYDVIEEIERLLGIKE